MRITVSSPWAPCAVSLLTTTHTHLHTQQGQGAHAAFGSQPRRCSATLHRLGLPFSKWCMGKYFLPWNYFTTLAGLHGVKPGVALGAVGTPCQLLFLCFLSFLCTVGTRGAANWLVIYAGIPFLVLRWMTLSIVVDLKGPHLEALYTASASAAICLSKHLKI